MERKGFTLVELLVVIAIIALLMGILMPALARVRQIAYRMVCGTNLSGIGKAMLVYANDYDDELPRSGGRNSKWAYTINNWLAVDRTEAYGLGAGGTGGEGSITSCFYLLVKYAEVTPKSFLCKGDSQTTEFNPVDYDVGNRELIEFWDFGGPQNNFDHPTTHCSYTYHLPFTMYALSTSSEPGLAVAADRNPWLEAPGWTPAKDPAPFNPDGGRDFVRAGNSPTHQDDGQNVLFLDGHVTFEKKSFCGINDDNIFTFWDGGDIRRCVPNGIPTITSEPKDRLDAMLVHDIEGKKTRCFPAGTPVWINGALMRISGVAAGQTVGKADFAAIVSLERVEKVDVHEGVFECRDIVLENGNCISVVDAHRFMLESGRWVAAPNLLSGMRLKSPSGPIAIRSVVTRAKPCVGKVYNLKVENGEKYLVGEDGLVVRDW